MTRLGIFFGGSGFIGHHLAKHLLDTGELDHIIIADLNPPESHPAHPFLADHVRGGKVAYVPCDVRKPIVDEALTSQIPALIVNLAAIHREPGHEPQEYFETNLKGAEEVCAFATRTGATRIVFTSSIAPYGPSETAKTEDSIPTPTTPYGISKLVAEHIHRTWQAGSPGERTLLILRPGVVFGPGEGGNVSRLVRAVTRRRFVFCGNRQTRKAGVYIQELCMAVSWLIYKLNIVREPVICANISMNPGPSIEEYVYAIQDIVQRRKGGFEIPFIALKLGTRIVNTLTTAINIDFPLNATRLNKMVKSNNILPKKLIELEYNYHFTLSSALYDWKNKEPKDWV